MDKLKSENEQMKVVLKNSSAHLSAQKQCVEELLQANITLKANAMLLEDHIKNTEKK